MEVATPRVPVDNFSIKRILQVFINVNNRRIKSLLVTGATRSFISDKMTNSVRVKVHPHRKEYNIINYDNQEVNSH